MVKITGRILHNVFTNHQTPAAFSSAQVLGCSKRRRGLVNTRATGAVAYVSVKFGFKTY